MIVQNSIEKEYLIIFFSFVYGITKISCSYLFHSSRIIPDINGQK